MGATEDDVQLIADVSRQHGLFIAVAESLTCGAIASRLGAGPEASAWFRGGVVAYDESVKFQLLGVTPGPVVTEHCAQQMARGVAGVLGADVAVSATGVGGPEPSEGKPAGTVLVAVTAVEGDGGTCRSFEFPGDPEDVIAATAQVAVGMLADVLRARFPDVVDDH